MRRVKQCVNRWSKCISSHTVKPPNKWLTVIEEWRIGMCEMVKYKTSSLAHRITFKHHRLIWKKCNTPWFFFSQLEMPFDRCNKDRRAACEGKNEPVIPSCEWIQHIIVVLKQKVCLSQNKYNTEFTHMRRGLVTTWRTCRWTHQNKFVEKCHAKKFVD